MNKRPRTSDETSKHLPRKRPSRPSSGPRLPLDILIEILHIALEQDEVVTCDTLNNATHRGLLFLWTYLRGVYGNIPQRFAQNNTFTLARRDYIWTYPPLPMNEWITSIDIEVNYEHRWPIRGQPSRMGDWRFLAKLARGVYGFKRLRHVKIIFCAKEHIPKPKCAWLGEEYKDVCPFDVDSFDVEVRMPTYLWGPVWSAVFMGQCCLAAGSSCREKAPQEPTPAPVEERHCTKYVESMIRKAWWARSTPPVEIPDCGDW